MDSDKDGILTINDMVDDIKKYKHLNSDPKVIEKYRMALCEFAASLGLYPGITLTKDEYVKAAAAHSQREMTTFESGEGSLLHKVNNALFDIVDKNHDGNISLEEYRAFTKMSSLDESYADAMFKGIDANHDGKVSRMEFSNYELKYWCTLEDIPGRDDIETALTVKKV